MRLFSLLLAILSFGAVALPAAAQTAEERVQLEWVQQRGWLIYALDRAAWLGTDDMLAQIPDAQSLGIRGWVVESQENAQIVTFYGGREEAPIAYYRSRIQNERVVSAEVFPADSRPALTPLQRRLASVAETARRLERQMCVNAAFNTVVIPPAALDDPVDVYLLTPQVRNSEWPVGGHYRATISVDGSVLSSRNFTNTCLVLGGDTPGATERVEALMVTHLLDPLPTEIHVFTMWTARLPIAVATQNPERLWWLSSDGIVLHGSDEERRLE